MTARTLLLAAALAVAAPAIAGEPPAVSLADLVGPRALGLSAATGIAASNEGIFLNPAAIGARQRYSIELGGLLDRRGADDVGEYFGGSVVDSMSSPLTGGVAFLRAQKGTYTGNVWDVAFAAPVAKDVLLAFAGKYLDVDGPDPSTAVTMDAGLFWQVHPLVSFGAAGYNLVPIANDEIAPLGAGAGIGIGSDRLVQVTADWRGEFPELGGTKNRFAAGVEVLLGRFLPLRAGWAKDDIVGGSWWSVGGGLVSQSGLALDVGYRQSIDDPDARTFAANLKLFLFR